MSRLPAGRLLLGGVGVLAMAYGVVRILTDTKDTKPAALLRWLVGTLLVHDVLIAPVVIGVGWLIGRALPPRAGRYLQAALVTGGLVSAVGLFLVWRQGKYSAASLALLQRDYRRNLLLVLGLIALAYLAGYLVEVARTPRRGDQARENRVNVRPPADQ
ncbi:MAG TPA: hypothetical protein VMB79_13245 [Jatrophihabitans sp.]|nr:hypothetical protein [Jatrophihabitans sp.]